MTGVIKFGVIRAPAVKTYTIKNYDGATYHVNFANEIRIMIEALQLRYDLIPAADNIPGVLEADGNWSGLIGMLLRSEVDVAMYPMSQGSETENIRFSYPYGVSDLTFMTNKPEPVSKNMAIFHPFLNSMWIAIAITLIILPIVFYILMKRKCYYQTILFNVFGNLLEQSFSIEIITNRARMLLGGWILGAMIISYGYKAVLLSSLSFPSTTVIRDIPQLGRAAAEGSVTCFTIAGTNIEYFTDSDIESRREIGACLKRNEHNFNSSNFRSLKSKKVFISSRRGLSFENDFYISTDSFGFQLYRFLVSKNFCCLKKFDRLINQLRAYGLDKKFEDEERFFIQRYARNFSTEESAPSTPSQKILLYDISGAFIIWMCGIILSFLIFIGEIVMKKYII